MNRCAGEINIYEQDRSWEINSELRVAQGSKREKERMNTSTCSQGPSSLMSDRFLSCLPPTRPLSFSVTFLLALPSPLSFPGLIHCQIPPPPGSPPWSTHPPGISAHLPTLCSPHTGPCAVSLNPQLAGRPPERYASHTMQSRPPGTEPLTQLLLARVHSPQK